MAYETITTELSESGVLRIMLNRPDSRNAINPQMWKDLDDALTNGAKNADCRVIVIGGNGKAFCAGMDLKLNPAYGDNAKPEGSPFDRAVDEAPFYLPLKWRSLPRPTIAMVHGACFINGFAIAQAMDIIIAAEDAKFVLAMPPFLVWPWQVPARVAKQLLYDPKTLSAAEAHALGLVNEVVPVDQLESHTMAMADRVATQTGERLGEIKRQINRIQEVQGLGVALEASRVDHLLRQGTGLSTSDSGGPRINVVANAMAGDQR
jgi:enoyl-CoA hydratase